MGLDTTHGAWHGAYSAFMRWRKKIAEVAGLPPLELMEGFYSEENVFSNPFSLLDYAYPKGDELPMSFLREIRKQFPIKWACLKPSPLHELLYHSDCDGEISYGSCGKIAKELEKLLPLLPEEPAGGHIDNWKQKTQTFIDGLKMAHSNKETLRFH